MAKKKLTILERQQLAGEFVSGGGTPVLPPMSDAARKRIEAEVSARWPYYKRAKEYRELVNEMNELHRCLDSILNPLAPWRPKAFGGTGTREYSAPAQATEKLYRDIFACVNVPLSWTPEASEVAEKMDLVLRKVLEQFGMLCLIPLEASVKDILDSELWRIGFFPKVLRPAYSNIQDSIPVEHEAKIRYLLKQASSLPVQLNLLQSKGEILAAVEGIIDAWQDRMKEVGIPFGSRHREPDYSLFPVYVEAYALRERGKSLKQIRDRLFPGEDAVAAERKTELYILNGRHLIRGQSDRIGQR